nr:hypothetical protein [Tanacetum cinerariifolium]
PVPAEGQVIPPDVLNTNSASVKALKEIAGLMLMTMDPDIQKNLKYLGAYDMLKELKTLYAQHAHQELLQTVREFHAHAMTQNLSLSLILVSLRKEYDGFVENYNMHSMGKTVTELHAMLKLHEQTLPPKEVAHALHAIRAGRIQKNQKKKSYKAAKGNQGKGKTKKGNALVPASSFAPKPKNPSTPKKDNPTKDAICHQCGEVVFQKRVENQLGKTIKSLRSDRGGKYMSHEFLDHLKDHRIIAHRTPPYTPQMNRVFKRRNRTMLDMVRSMMSQTTLPKSFWDYALKSAARILNMVPTKKALIKHDTLTKLDKPKPRSIKCIFVGYPKETMGYSFYHPPENKVFVARNAEFLENSLIVQEASRSLVDLEIIQEEDTHPFIDTGLYHEEDDQKIDEPQSDIDPIHRSTRTHRAPDRMCLYIDAKEHDLGDLGEPANYKVALLDPESDKWLNAMNVEMQSMKDNEVWELVDLPPSGKTVGHKRLFKKKTNKDGAVHTYKARLVVKGFTQTPRIDYEETFSPVADIRAIRILIAIAAFYNYEIWQMDVKTAFLNEYLNEEVYMEQPEGFVNQKFSNRSPGEVHWTAVKNILKYLCNTNDMFLVYGGDTKRELRVSCYTDVGYLTDADDMKSQTGYVFVLNGCLTGKARSKAVWIRKFISRLGVVPTIEEPINMCCVNTGAIAITKDHGVTKDIFTQKFTIFEKP